MLQLAKLLKSDTGCKVMSILLGLGLAALIRTACKTQGTVYLPPPNLDTVVDEVFRRDGKCYHMQKEHVACDSRKITVRV